jgi:Type I restriction enzyme R protein N terminus (HSDR_N)
VPIITQQLLDALPTCNETEIRFHLVDPILRLLGYPGSDEVYVKLEEKLEYPYYHIGHKSKKRDQPLGFPDYRAGLKGARGSFIIEAKAGSVVVSQEDVEQAHSYAAHAQVGANYFVLCDGTSLSVFATLSGPDHTPIVEMLVSEIDIRFHELENVLSPKNLAENCRVTHDLNLKLCDGLKSSVKIRSGEYNMDGWEIRVFVNETDLTAFAKATLPQFVQMEEQLAILQREFELKVSDGLTKRDDDGRISARVHFEGVTKNNQAGMKLLGIDNMSWSTNDKFISIDAGNPTAFESTADFSLEQGAMIAPLFGSAVPSERDIAGEFFISARVHKSGDQLLGEYVAMADYRFEMPGLGATRVEFDFFGQLSLRLIVP